MRKTLLATAAVTVLGPGVMAATSKAAVLPPPVTISSVNRSASFPALSNSVHRGIFDK
jgi:hypothetical protein